MKPSRSNSSRKRRITFDYQNLEARQMLSGNLPAIDAQVELTRLFLGNNPDTQHLVQAANDISYVESKQVHGETTTLLQQTRNGIPVYGAYLTVVQNANGDFETVQGGQPVHLNTSSLTVAQIGSDAAEQTANAQFAGQTLETFSKLVWTDASQLAWQVDTYLEGVGEGFLPADFATIINAHSGEVITQDKPTGVTQLLYNPNTTTGVNPRIVINDTIGAQGSRDYALTFGAVVALPGCTGTLISANTVISARHCGSNAGDAIRFGADSGNPEFTATVDSVLVPAGPGSLLDGGDFNILTLTEDVPATVATPMRLTDATTDLEGMVAATVGYGFNGVGSIGHEFTSDGFRWGGENIIDAYGVPAGQAGVNIISTDFDDGTAGSNTIPSGDMNPLTFEATTAPGDSGGPILIKFGSEWVVSGVLSGGTSSTSVYGDISWWTGVQPYRALIEAAGGIFAEGDVSFNSDAYKIGDTVTVTVNGLIPSDPTLDVTVSSSLGDVETLTLNAVGMDYVGTIVLSNANVAPQDGVLQAQFGGMITADFGSASTDSATIDDQIIVGTNGNDTIVVEIGSTVHINVNGVDFFVNPTIQRSLHIDALRGRDTITITDGAGNDLTRLGEYYVDVDGFFDFTAASVEVVTVKSGGGFDTARMFGTDRDDVFASIGDTNTFTGQQFVNKVMGYRNVVATATEGGFDRASFTDTAGSDRFFATPVLASMTTSNTYASARGFDKVTAHASEGGFDFASFVGSAGSDSLFSNPKLANLKGAGFELNASGFERTSADGAGGDDTANLVGSDGNDIYFSNPQFGYLYGTGYFNHAIRFENMIAHAGLGFDQANLYDSPGADSFHATPTSAVLMNNQYRSQANMFDKVSAIGTAGFDSAILVDSAGIDRYIARPADAYMIGSGYLNYTRGFNSVTGRSSGGSDVAIFHDSREDDRIFGSREFSVLTGTTFHNRAENFRRVTAFMTRGVDRGRFEDSVGSDTFIANGTEASLFNDDYFVRTIGLDVVTAVSENGGTDVLGKANLELVLIEQGNWNL